MRSKTKIIRTRIQPGYDKKRMVEVYHLGFMLEGERVYHGLSKDFFDTLDGAKLALQLHSNGSRVYIPRFFHLNSKIFICEPVEQTQL